MKMWRCEVCGYLHEGEEPPDFCHKCGAPKEQFELLDEEEAEMMRDALATREKYAQIYDHLEAVNKLAQEGIDLNLDEGCNDIFKCVVDDDMQKIYPLIMKADAIILGSPTYFYNVSADIKAFIDRCYCLVKFDEKDRSVWMSVNEAAGGRYAAVIAVCEQQHEKDMGHTADTMEMTLQSLGYRIVDTVKVTRAFAAGEVRNNDKSMQEARQAGEKILKTLKLRKSIEVKLEKI